MRQLQANITLHAVRCAVPQETPIPPAGLFWGALQTNTRGPETWKSCNSIWSWGFVEDLLTCHSPHWWNMPASVLNHKPLAQELRSKGSGSIFSCWTLSWWQKGVSAEVGINTLPGWSRCSGLWKPCQSRCSWPETQYVPPALSSSSWKGAEHSLQLWQCSKHREWLQQCLHSCLWQYAWVFTILLQKYKIALEGVLPPNVYLLIFSEVSCRN